MAFADCSTPLLEMPVAKVPHHIAIIMDGNRRWAKKRGFPLLVGYWKGAETLTQVVRAVSKTGVKILTVYAFSTENWSRSKEEISALIHLFKIYLKKQKQILLQEGICLKTIGNVKKFPQDFQDLLQEVKEATASGKTMDLVLALNYGGRDDICRAVERLLAEQQKKQLSGVTEEMFAGYLDTAGFPDPDLLIRTSGEKRQSNFLLWQLSYSEFYYTDVLWPEFGEEELFKAMQEYQIRSRRFGLSGGI